MHEHTPGPHHEHEHTSHDHEPHNDDDDHNHHEHLSHPECGHHDHSQCAPDCHCHHHEASDHAHELFGHHERTHDHGASCHCENCEAASRQADELFRSHSHGHEHAHGEAGHICGSNCQHGHTAASQSADELFQPKATEVSTGPEASFSELKVAAPPPSTRTEAHSASTSANHNHKTPMAPATKAKKPRTAKPDHPPKNPSRSTPPEKPKPTVLEAPTARRERPAPEFSPLVAANEPAVKNRKVVTSPITPKKTSAERAASLEAPMNSRIDTPEAPVAPTKIAQAPEIAPSAVDTVTPEPIPAPVQSLIASPEVPSPAEPDSAFRVASSQAEPAPLPDIALSPEPVEPPDMPREAPLADLPALSDTEHVIPIGADDLPPAEAPDIDNTIDTFTLPTGTDAAPAFVSETDPWADRSFAPLTEEAPDFAGLSVENDVLPSPESFVVPEALPPDQPGDYIPSFDLPDAGHIPMVKGKRYAHHPVASAEQVPATNSEIIIAIRSPEVERILVHLRTLSRRGGNYPATRQLVQLLATKLGVSEEQARTLLSLTLDYRASVGTAAAITQLLRGQLPASMSQAPPEQKTSWLMRLRRYIRRRLARVWVRINRTLPLADMAKL